MEQGVSWSYTRGQRASVSRQNGSTWASAAEGPYGKARAGARAGGRGGPGRTRPRSTWLRSSRADGPGRRRQWSCTAPVSMLKKITPSRSRAARGGPQPGPHPLRGGCDLLLAAGNGIECGEHEPLGDRSLQRPPCPRTPAFKSAGISASC